jgi:hypothetical protein
MSLHSVAPALDLRTATMLVLWTVENKETQSSDGL